MMDDAQRACESISRNVWHSRPRLCKSLGMNMWCIEEHNRGRLCHILSQTLSVAAFVGSLTARVWPALAAPPLGQSHLYAVALPGR